MKPSLVSLLLACGFLAAMTTACGTTKKVVQVNDTKIEVPLAEDSETEVYDGVMRRWNASNQLVERRVYVDGQLHGPYESWYSNQKRRAVGTFARGLREGEWTFYRRSGEVWARGAFRNDQRSGRWKFQTPGGEVSVTVDYSGADPVVKYHAWGASGMNERDLYGRFCEPQAIRERFVAHSEDFEECFDKELGLETGLEGKLMYEFVIGPEGDAAWGEISGSTLSSPAVEICLLEEMATLQFERPTRLMCKVNYPLIFWSKPRKD